MTRVAVLPERGKVRVVADDDRHAEPLAEHGGDQGVNIVGG